MWVGYNGTWLETHVSIASDIKRLGHAIAIVEKLT